MINLTRVHLRKSLNGPLDEEAVRAAFVELARFACNGSKGQQKGDPIFERVTEGRQGCWLINGKRRCYSSCGDLPHFAAWLACGAVLYDDAHVRKSLRWINRKEAWGWRQGWNLIKLHAETGSAWTKHRKGDSVVADTRPGDVWMIGEYGLEHVFVIESIEGNVVRSFDYGGFFVGSDGVARHGGRGTTKTLRRGVDGRTWAFGDKPPGRPLAGRLDTFAALVAADRHGEGSCSGLDAALVPEGFPFGIPTDNPYFEPYFTPAP